MEVFLLGLIIGLVTSAPIGPVGLLAIQRTLTHGRLAGILSGAGAAVADAFYAGLADLSLSVVSGFLASARLWIHLGAGLLCLWLGGRAIFFRPLRQAPTRRYSGRGLVWHFISSALLTLANPLTILFFIVVFTTLQLDHADTNRLLLTVAGVFTGCLVWWTALSLTTAHLHNRLHSRTLIMINRISAIFIITLGILALGSAGHTLLIEHMSPH
jgi:threonine/homoserine/homoserine lactone efflux protein